MTAAEREQISRDDIEAKRLLIIIRELEKKLHNKPVGKCERCINQRCHIGHNKMNGANYGYPAINDCANFCVDFPRRQKPPSGGSAGA